MEQHKVLMVIVSVTLFLAAVVGMSMYLLYPHEAETPQEARADGDESGERFDPIEYMRRPDELPRLTLRDPDPEEDVIIVYGERDDLRVRPEEYAEDMPDEEALRAPDPDPDREEVETGEPREPREPEAPPEEHAPETPEERVTERRPRPEPEGAPAPAPDTAPERAPEPELRRERVTEYWIQVISSPRRDTVDRARSRLDQRDLGTRVTTTEMNGSTFYRLRIGPYRSKPEAEKFLEIVSGVDGFEESYISEEYPLRTVTR